MKYASGIPLVFAAVALAAACGDDGPTAGALENDGTMSAMIGDTLPWSANLNVSATLEDGELLIQGLERTGKLVKLSIRDVTVDPQIADINRTVSFSFFTAATTGYAFFSESSSDNFTTTVSGGSGTVVLQRLTETRAEGTFTFIAARAEGDDPVRRLAQGKFDVRIR
jgi:hypothetical protein